MAMTDAQIRAMFADPGRAPPSSRLMGFELVDFSQAGGWVETAFTARPEFLNPMGNVQGGFVTGMLDDAMAVAALIKSGFTKVVPTLQMTVTFLAPVSLGQVLVRGEVLRLGGATAQMAGTLRLADGTVAATAVAAAVVRDMPGQPKARG